MNNQVVLACRNLKKVFDDGRLKVPVLNEVTLEIFKGEKIAIIGPSGSGKSTLLQLLAGLDTNFQGSVLINGHDVSGLKERQRCQIRTKNLGFIYQFHHLLAEFSALENVMLPRLLSGSKIKEAKDRAEVLLASVGLEKRLNHKPSQLSGGERQRVAIARSMVNQPQCILADEPTGNLDASTAKSVMNNLLDLDRKNETALMVVTHDLSLAKKMDRVLRLVDGKLMQDVVL